MFASEVRPDLSHVCDLKCPDSGSLFLSGFMDCIYGKNSCLRIWINSGVRNLLYLISFRGEQVEVASFLKGGHADVKMNTR